VDKLVDYIAYRCFLLKRKSEIRLKSVIIMLEEETILLKVIGLILKV